MIAEFLQSSREMSDKDVLAQLNSCTLSELRAGEQELLYRRQEIRIVFGHINSPLLPDSAGSREYEMLVRLTDLVKVAIARKHFEASDHSDSTIVESFSQSAVPSAASWDAVELVFLSENKVQIRINGIIQEPLNYAELRFADERNQKPNKAWLTLLQLATAGGTIGQESMAGRNRSKVEKRIQEIRKVLRTRLGISRDPLPFVRGVGYKAAFKISLAPAYET